MEKGMDIFDEPLWRSTKIHMLVSGAWPFELSLYRTIVKLIVFALMESIIVLEVVTLYNVWGNLELTVNCYTKINYTLTIHIAAFFNAFNLKKTKKLLLLVKNNWESGLLDESEMKVMRDDGIAHRSTIYSYYLLYYSQPGLYWISTIIPPTLDFLVPRNETRIRLFIFDDHYGVDIKENYFYLLSHQSLALLIFSWSFVTYTITYCTLVQYACSMFTIIGGRLKHLGSAPSGGKRGTNCKVKSDVKSINLCVKMHQDTLEFVRLLQDNFCFSLLFMIAVNAIGISTIGFRFVVMAHGMEENIQCLAYFFGQIVYIYYMNFFGQKLMDCNDCILESIYAAKVYNFSREIKPMVILLMLRTKIGVKLMAGKLFIMSLENFTNIMKMSFSYCTVLLSLQ